MSRFATASFAAVLVALTAFQATAQERRGTGWIGIAALGNGTVIQARADATEHEIYVFETSWCPYCRQLRAMLDRNHVKYTSFDIDRNARARAFMVQNFKTTAVPVVVIDGRSVLGFNEPLIRQLLSR
jgi:glutaredoxin